MSRTSRHNYMFRNPVQIAEEASRRKAMGLPVFRTWDEARHGYWLHQMDKAETRLDAIEEVEALRAEVKSLRDQINNTTVNPANHPVNFEEA